MTTPDCPFCLIIQRKLPARILYEDDSILAFQDARPIAPAHVLVIPKQHIPSLNETKPEDAELLGHMVLIGQQMAKKAGVDQTGFRLVINTGPHAGQSVFHIHLHMIGGRHLPFRFE